jgi:hypothetical protein
MVIKLKRIFILIFLVGVLVFCLEPDNFDTFSVEEAVEMINERLNEKASQDVKNLFYGPKRYASIFINIAMNRVGNALVVGLTITDLIAYP